jgi:hypothetical protein
MRPSAKREQSARFFTIRLTKPHGQGKRKRPARTRLVPLQNFFARTGALSGVHVRLGTVTGKRRRQKEVDILLATDMLTHGFNGNMKTAVLLSGDLDFRPIIEARSAWCLRRGVVSPDVHNCRAARCLRLSLCFCGFLWPFVASRGLLWPFEAFCGIEAHRRSRRDCPRLSPTVPICPILSRQQLFSIRKRSDAQNSFLLFPVSRFPSK